jgi:hypothetical protein
MPNPNVGDYKGRIGLSPPAAYPSTMGNEVNEGNVKLRHHVYAIKSPLLEHPPQRWMMNP